jgi:hypothetical protein
MRLNIPPTLFGNDSSKMQKIRAILQTKYIVIEINGA